MPPDALGENSHYRWSEAGDRMVDQVLQKFGGQFVGKSRKEAYWIARRLLKKTFADYRKGRPAGAPKVACRSDNCFGCCLYQKEVDTSPYEVETIIDRLVQEDRLAPVVAKAEKLASHGKGGACPLLSRNGKCTVYDIRPLACAAYHSPDYKACRGGAEASIPQIEELWAATSIIVGMGFLPLDVLTSRAPKPRYYLFKMLAELGGKRLETKEAA